MTYVRKLLQGGQGAALKDLCAEFDFPDLSEISDIHQANREGIRSGLRKLPDGEWREEMMMDIDGIEEPQPLVVTVRIEGDQLYADFTGTAPPIRRQLIVDKLLKGLCSCSCQNDMRSKSSKQSRDVSTNYSNGTGRIYLIRSYPAACFWRLSAGMLVAELMFKIFLAAYCRTECRQDQGHYPPGGLRHRQQTKWRYLCTSSALFWRYGWPPGEDGLSAVSFPYNVTQCFCRMV